MGHQINFYMNSSIENEFINLIVSNNFNFLKINKQAKCIDMLPIDLMYNEWRCFLHKINYGNVRMIENINGDVCDIDYTYSPVIQYIRTQVNYKQMIITRGRLLITSKNLTGGLANNKELIKDYNMLMRWIKKKVPYQSVVLKNIFGDECITKEYINNDLIELVNSGFRLH